MNKVTLKFSILSLIFGLVLLISYVIINDEEEFILIVIGVISLIIGIVGSIIYMIKEKSLKVDNNDWNMFINNLSSKNLNELSRVQKNAVLCFWYDTEMESGGHEGWFSNYSDVKPSYLEKALLEVSNKEIVDNFKEALAKGKKDDYIKNDNKYYSFEPRLDYYIENYIEKHHEEIFKDFKD